MVAVNVFNVSDLEHRQLHSGRGGKEVCDDGDMHWTQSKLVAAAAAAAKHRTRKENNVEDQRDDVLDDALSDEQIAERLVRFVVDHKLQRTPECTVTPTTENDMKKAALVYVRAARSLFVFPSAQRWDYEERRRIYTKIQSWEADQRERIGLSFVIDAKTFALVIGMRDFVSGQRFEQLLIKALMETHAGIRCVRGHVDNFLRSALTRGSGRRT